ncbi:retrovirus-related pol polyprotein from transposon TNT 1-94 [Tanacetum coccineum]
MSMMGELKFFLGLQVHQSPRSIFICQSQYAIKLLKKHGMDECVSMSTPMAIERLDANLQGTPTDQTTYHRMIGELIYLTASRPDISFATFICARYQARHTVKHLKEVKRIFRCLRQSYNMGLWYLRDSGFELIAYSNANHAGFIMVQPQRQADIHQDELCPPNKRYALMDANKKIDIEHLLCLNESKILANILQNHLLRFSIVDSPTLKQNDNQNDPDTRLEPKSNKESQEAEITAAVQPVNVNEEEEESAEDDYELRRREKGSM